MILICPQCQSQYNLDEEKLGSNGRTVRCVSCKHTWFQQASGQGGDSEQIAALVIKPEQAPPETPHPEPGPAKESPAATPEEDEAIFDAILSEVISRAAPVPDVPVSVMSELVVKNDSLPPVITHNPFGVGAAAFGTLTFLLCVSLTLAALFVLQKPVVHHWPQMALLYKTIGLHPMAPGEGLRISEVSAGQKTENNGKILVVDGKMTNMSEHATGYPPLHVSLKNDKNILIKEWNLKAGITRISSGETVPLMLQLPDAPSEGTVVELRVQDE